MNKKYLILFLLLAVTFACYACGKAEISGSSAEQSASVSEPETSSLPSHSESSATVIELSDETDSEITEETFSEQEESSSESTVESSEPEHSSETESSQTAESSEPAETSEPKENSETSKDPVPEKPHTVNGFLVYQGRAMEQFGGSSKSGANAAAIMNAFKEKVGESVNVYAMPVPLACTFYSPEGYEKNYRNMKDCFYGLRDSLSGIVFVDLIEALEPHAEESIYARTDHHWFARGAYYAAEALCREAGADFDLLESFTENSFDGFLGSCYSSYKVTELKKYPETFYWYEPTREYTAHYFNQKFQKEASSGSMFGSNRSYTKFIRGDGYAVRIDSDVSNHRKLLVIKDSFGNALAPFLIAGFEQVYVIDFRAFESNVLTLIKENEITDVVFALSAFSIASSSKCENITRLTKI